MTIENILDILHQYQNNDFTNKIDNKYQGEIAKLVDGINSLNDSITKMLIQNEKEANLLQHDSNELLNNVKLLNHSTTKTAASLEETAAAMQEISSNISATTESISQMTIYSKELGDAATSGEKLANQTTKAMDEINEQVNLINEAISVIDQIAFQTNILSLNAAVEAATAGEAGKGFAVVAGEVRNLAARSAEAANEIKKLVENATIKANTGKDIAQTMINGYNELNNSIDNTINLIKSVEDASKNQQISIEDINNIINDLQEQTKQNAQIAQKTNQIAHKTNQIASIIINSVNEKIF